MVRMLSLEAIANRLVSSAVHLPLKRVRIMIYKRDSDKNEKKTTKLQVQEQLKK